MADLTANTDTLTGNLDGPVLLTSHRMPLPATFRFDYFGMPFDVGIRRMAEGGAELVVRGQLGNIPYSAESVAAREVLRLVVEAGRFLPMVDINVDSKQAIVARGLMAFQSIPSPATVAAGAAAIGIAVKPLCELIVKCLFFPAVRGQIAPKI